MKKKTRKMKKKEKLKQDKKSFRPPDPGKKRRQCLI